MIEFKGQCGHSIRARDEDAGKTVRCSYCGRECQVPEGEDDAFDSLFGDVEKTGVFDPAATKAGAAQRRSRSGGSRSKPRRKSGDFDPFAVVVKMGAVAVVIIVIAIGWTYGQKGVAYVKNQLQSTPTPAPTPKPTSAPRSGDSRSGGSGLVAPKLPTGQSGIYVCSVPPDAMVYLLSEKDVKGSILTNESADIKRKTNAQVTVNPGRYRVAVALPVSTRELMGQPGYRKLRHDIEDRLSKPADVSGFFLPDGSAVEARLIRDEWYLVRTYEDVVVFKNEWSGVTALFLPRLDVRQLLDFLPTRSSYSFNTIDIKEELGFYDVPSTDQDLVMSALRRVGKIVYRKDARLPYQEFTIRLSKGTLKRTVVKD